MPIRFFHLFIQYIHQTYSLLRLLYYPNYHDNDYECHQSHQPATPPNNRTGVSGYQDTNFTSRLFINLYFILLFTTSLAKRFWCRRSLNTALLGGVLTLTIPQLAISRRNGNGRDEFLVFFFFHPLLCLFKRQGARGSSGTWWEMGRTGLKKGR